MNTQRAIKIGEVRTFKDATTKTYILEGISQRHLASKIAAEAAMRNVTFEFSRYTDYTTPVFQFTVDTSETICHADTMDAVMLKVQNLLDAA